MEVEAVWKKNYQVEVQARQFNVQVDEAPEFHGEDTGMMPTELFLCSLASCYCLALVYVAGKKKTEVRDMSVKVIGKKDRKKFRFTRLIVKVESSISSEILEEIVKLAKGYCFVSNAITGSCPIEYTVNTF